MSYTSFEKTLSGLTATANEGGEQAAFDDLGCALSNLAQIRTEMSPDEERVNIDSFRRRNHHIILQSDFNRYVFTRPRGYPGDFITQEMVWRGRTEQGDHRYAGVSETGKLLTALTLDMAASQANEARMNRLADLLATYAFKRVASIGCGPAIEYRLVPGDLPSDIFLLDQDADALAHARANTKHVRAAVTCHKENVVRFALRNSKRKCLGERDLIYAFGLFDYLPFKIARRVVSSLWVSLAPGGKMLITNAHPDNPTRLWMEWGGEWYLDYKDEEELFGLAWGLENVADMICDIDEFGVYQYLVIEKAT